MIVAHLAKWECENTDDWNYMIANLWTCIIFIKLVYADISGYLFNHQVISVVLNEHKLFNFSDKEVQSESPAFI
jgi:hypothetical protein